MFSVFWLIIGAIFLLLLSFFLNILASFIEGISGSIGKVIKFNAIGWGVILVLRILASLPEFIANMDIGMIVGSLVLLLIVLGIVIAIIAGVLGGPILTLIGLIWEILDFILEKSASSEIRFVNALINIGNKLLNPKQKKEK